jgi:hypothetical protein
MEADAFWHCVGQTALWRSREEDNYPWNQKDFRMAAALGRRAHKAGLTYGAYILSFLVEGDFRKADYDFTTSWSPEGGLIHTHFISLEDPRRHRDLVWLLKALDSMPTVDYLGLDYLRTDFGGLEFTDEFLRDMSLRPPLDLEKKGMEGRQKWLGRIAVLHEDPVVEEIWQWWRSHKVAEVVDRLLEDAQVHKPVWVFSLGWKQGHQHGQDPFMLIDAGISFNAPMFYEANEEQFRIMLESWQDYLSRRPDSVVLGQPVDGKLLGEDGSHSGPEEHFQRQMRALQALGPVAGSLGFFWHDVSRAMVGGRSHEGAREWAAAGAAAFTRLREAQKVMPLHLEVGQVQQTARGLSFTATVENLSDSPVAWYRLEGLPMKGLESFEPDSLRGGPLAPHHKALHVLGVR